MSTSILYHWNQMRILYSVLNGLCTKQTFTRLGLPEEIVLDNYTTFELEEYQGFLLRKSIKCNSISSFLPKINEAYKIQSKQ